MLRKYLADEYGGLRGFVSHLEALVQFRLGKWRACRAVDWRSVRRLVFICKGNVCRSPYAEARARSLGLATDSFGLEVMNPSKAEPNAITVARQRMISLDDHRSTPLRIEDLRDGDLLVGMEPAHIEAIAARRELSRFQTTLLGCWSRPPRPYLQDPMGRSEDYFRACYAVIDSAVEDLASHLAVTVELRREQPTTD